MDVESVTYVEQLFAQVDEAKAAGDAERAALLLEEALSRPDLDLVYSRGSVVDELIDVYVTQGKFAEAEAAVRRAMEGGWLTQAYGDVRLAGLLLSAGRVEEGAAAYAALRGTDLHDVYLTYDAGMQVADAGLYAEAAEWLGEAVRQATAENDADGLLEEILDARRAMLRTLGMDDDAIQREGVAVQRRTGIVKSPAHRHDMAALAWFPDWEYDDAKRYWPDLAAVFGDSYAEYTRNLETQLHGLYGAGIHPAVAPLEVEEYVEWCRDAGLDAGAASSRAEYAAEVARRGQAVVWPPSRNGPCWCGSGNKYKLCCGAAPPD